jgi:hypothetical protein
MESDQVNPKLAKFLVISAKQAVGALVGNAALGTMLPQVFNFHDPAHALAFLKATGGFILAAEAKVWLPKAARMGKFAYHRSRSRALLLRGCMKHVQVRPEVVHARPCIHLRGLNR